MVQMNRFAGQKLRHRCREQTYGHQGGESCGGGGGGGVLNWEIGIDMYTLMCIKLMTNKNLLYKNKFKKRLKIELPYHPAIPLLGTYPEKTIIQKESCTTVLIAALFTIARTWKQSKCPSTDEWIKKMWHIYNVQWNILQP